MPYAQPLVGDFGSVTTGRASISPGCDLPSITAVVNDFPAPSQTFIRRKLDGLKAAGLPVTVAATNFHPDAEEPGFSLLRTAPWLHPTDLRSSRGRAEWRTVLRAAAKGGPAGRAELRQRVLAAPLAAADTDIIHFEFSGIAVTYLDSLDDLRRRARLAVSCRGAAEQIQPLRDPSRADALRKVFSMMDLIHCVSDDMRRTVERYGAPPERIVVNRPAVPVQRFIDLRSHEGPSVELRVLSVARLHWKKGLDDGLRALAALRSSGIDATYRIAGEGPEREKLMFLTDQLGLADAVQLLGTCTEAQVRDELREAHVLLLPSLSEGISNSVLEAMAAGRAVVTTDCGGMTEVVTDGVDGFVVPVGDTSTMADRLATLARDPQLRQSIAQQAAATADREFDISRQVAVFVDAYRRIAS